MRPYKLRDGETDRWRVGETKTKRCRYGERDGKTDRWVVEIERWRDRQMESWRDEDKEMPIR